MWRYDELIFACNWIVVRCTSCIMHVTAITLYSHSHIHIVYCYDGAMSFYPSAIYTFLWIPSVMYKHPFLYPTSCLWWLSLLFSIVYLYSTCNILIYMGTTSVTTNCLIFTLVAWSHVDVYLHFVQWPLISILILVAIGISASPDAYTKQASRDNTISTTTDQ